ncbi:MAG: DUF1398 family protein [Bacteroidales bacterium]|nr:DUF1398 family protein [Bacteroidales bacterium]
MFTIEQIDYAFEKVKSGVDFPQFVQQLKEIGVTHYDTFVSDGLTRYYGINDFIVDGEPKYPKIEINNISSVEKLKHAISIHQQGQTDYPTFCQQVSNAGVVKWTTNMNEMTVTYLDKSGNKLMVASIQEP